MITLENAKKAGFSETEFNDYVEKKRAEGLRAGFSNAEINEYFGIVEKPEPAQKPFNFLSTAGAATLPTVADPQDVQPETKPQDDIYDKEKYPYGVLRAGPGPETGLFGRYKQFKPSDWDRYSPVEKFA